MNHVKNNNCEKKNFFNSNLFLILSISFSVLVIGGSIIYVFYQSSISGIINGTIAKWDFKANNLTSKLDLSVVAIEPKQLILLMDILNISALKKHFFCNVINLRKIIF